MNFGLKADELVEFTTGNRVIQSIILLNSNENIFFLHLDCQNSTRASKCYL